MLIRLYSEGNPSVLKIRGKNWQFWKYRASDLNENHITCIARMKNRLNFWRDRFSGFEDTEEKVKVIAISQSYHWTHEYEIVRYFFLFLWVPYLRFTILKRCCGAIALPYIVLDNKCYQSFDIDIDTMYN